VFERELAPVFDKRFVRWLTDQPAALFGLGIPPAQFDALAGDQPMAQVLRRRLEKLACDFPVDENYFAWQAFSRGYARSDQAPLPPYLQAANWDVVRARAARVQVLHANFTEHLATLPDASRDRYVLLDAQDWMSDDQLNALWQQITRTARPGARVLFRTAAAPTLLPGRVAPACSTAGPITRRPAPALPRAIVPRSTAACIFTSCAHEHAGRAGARPRRADGCDLSPPGAHL
jgi:S-adenosylmethionine-diacylglycerol 3-amino-3-carboxypropyl transferase